LEWLAAEGCPWSENTFAAAATTGNLNLLKWLRRNGCRWDDRTFQGASAASKGCNPGIIKWLKGEDCPGFDEASAQSAVQRYNETTYKEFPARYFGIH